MPPPDPIPIDAPDAKLLGDLLRRHVPHDGAEDLGSFSHAPPPDLVLRDLPEPLPGAATPEPPQTITDVDSAPSLLDEGLKIRKTPE
jgi:hypothetical protein